MARPNLLLVDDDTRSLRVMEVSLRNAGFEVTTAGDGEEALKRLEAAAPSLIICDTHMPGMDGYAFCGQIKGDDRFKQIPFVFLTEHGSTEDKVKGLELGVDDYLTKPIYIKEVITRVQLVLQKHERSSLATMERKRFYGSLESMGVVDLLQTLEMGGRSGVLSFEHQVKPAQLWFTEGKIIDAVAGRLTGAQAVYRMLTWEQGSFEIDFSDVDRPASVDESTQALILEGMRQVDEWGRMIEQLPSINSVFHVDYAELAERLSDLPPAVNDLVRLFDGRRSALQVIFDGDLSDLDALAAICQLYFEGVIYEADGPAEASGAALSVPRADISPMEGPVLDAPLGPVQAEAEVKGLVDDLLTAARTPMPNPGGARLQTGGQVPETPAPQIRVHTPIPEPTPAPEVQAPPIPDDAGDDFMSLGALATEQEAEAPGDDVATVRNALNASLLGDDTPAPESSTPATQGASDRSTPPPVPLEGGDASGAVEDHAHETDFFNSPMPEEEDLILFDEEPSGPMPKSAWAAIVLFGGAVLGVATFAVARDEVDPQVVEKGVVHHNWHNSVLKTRTPAKQVAALKDADWRVFPEQQVAPAVDPEAVAEVDPEAPTEDPAMVAEAPAETPPAAAQPPAETPKADPAPEQVAEQPPATATDDNTKEFNKLLKNGLAAVRKENYGKAVNILDKALDLNPRHPKALLNYVQATLEEGMIKKSLQAANKLVQIQPKNADAWMFKGTAHQELKQSSKAVAAYERFIALKPNSPYAAEVKTIISREKVQ
ncbi:MAG: response regulator [Bradymonadia bacterium]